eukprot:SAG31_NODE_9_length_42330_cov_441.979162_28_plen_33_part_00
MRYELVLVPVPVPVVEYAPCTTVNLSMYGRLT